MYCAKAIEPHEGATPYVEATEKRRTPGLSRSAILDATRDLLKTGSYDSLSMDAIVHAASLSRRTLYNQFVSKDDLYRKSRETLIHELAEQIVEEIPPRLKPFEGFRFFAGGAFDVLRDDRNVELRHSIVRDGAGQAWLAASYQRFIRAPLVRTCENFILQQISVSGGIEVSPRIVAEQFVAVIDALATGARSTGDHRAASRKGAASSLDIVARAYASMLDGSAK